MSEKIIRIIPVLDIMRGFVVHAIRGERSSYKPYTDSILCSNADPKCVIDKLYDMGFRMLYVADLDAIIGVGDNYWVIEYALSKGFNVLADVGRRGLSLRDLDNINYVIGTEYLIYPDELHAINNRVASLDLEFDRVKTSRETLEIDEIMNKMVNMGIMPKALLIINLKYVGTMQGINKRVLEKVRTYYNGRLYTGGGLRSPDELLELKEYNLDGVLVATTLHKGLITRPYYYL